MASVGLGPSRHLLSPRVSQALSAPVPPVPTLSLTRPPCPCAHLVTPLCPPVPPCPPCPPLGGHRSLPTGPAGTAQDTSRSQPICSPTSERGALTGLACQGHGHPTPSIGDEKGTWMGTWPCSTQTAGLGGHGGWCPRLAGRGAASCDPLGSGRHQL